MKNCNQMKHRFHPWHGLTLGESSPQLVNCYVEMVPTDTVKYELDKVTGILKVDRPQKYSSLCPSLYGLLPQTYAGQRVAAYCSQKSGRSGLVGDGDPLDICILTQSVIAHGDIIVRAVPIGGFRLLDGEEVDDKIIGVMVDDLVYGDIRDIQECPQALIHQLEHYFLTYKDSPDRSNCRVEILETYGSKEAQEIINLGSIDYQKLIHSVQDDFPP